MRNLLLSSLILIPSLIEAAPRPTQPTKLSFDDFVEMCEMDQGTPSRTTRNGKTTYSCTYGNGDKITCTTSGQCTSTLVHKTYLEKFLEEKALESARG